MKLSEHIAHCQQMLEKFGDDDIELQPRPDEIYVQKRGVAIVHHHSFEESYYTIRRSYS